MVKIYLKSGLKVFLITLVYFICLIVFEAAQQLYYLTTFNLINKGEISFFDLLYVHSTRWLIWSILALPMGVYVFYHPIRNLTVIAFTRYVFWALATLLMTLFMISIIELFLNKQSFGTFWEYFLFFTYQKAALFVNAYLGLIILINLYHSIQLLDSKIIELSDLKNEYESLYDELSQHTNDKEVALIQIKIGNKIKNLLLSEVIWLQSDDYCVRVHTEKGAYNLRKSMKAMEQELSTRGFIRIHRNAIVNKEEIDTLDFSQEPQVYLKNGQILPIAKSRISKIKTILKSNSSFSA